MFCSIFCLFALTKLLHASCKMALKIHFFRLVPVGDIEIHYVGARALFCNYIPKSHHLIIALHAWSALLAAGPRLEGNCEYATFCVTVFRSAHFTLVPQID